MSIHLPQGTPKGHPSITGPFFSASRTAWLTSNVHRQVYIGETGRKLANRFREYRRDVINRRNDLPVWSLRYWRQAWPNRDTARSRICFWFSDMERWLRVTSIKTLVSRELLTLLPTRAPVVFYPDKGSNAETYISVGLFFLFCLVTLRAFSLNKGTCL